MAISKFIDIFPSSNSDETAFKWIFNNVKALRLNLDENNVERGKHDLNSNKALQSHLGIDHRADRLPPETLPCTRGNEATPAGHSED